MWYLKKKNWKCDCFDRENPTTFFEIFADISIVLQKCSLTITV